MIEGSSIISRASLNDEQSSCANIINAVHNFIKSLEGACCVFVAQIFNIIYFIRKMWNYSFSLLCQFMFSHEIFDITSSRTWPEAYKYFILLLIESIWQHIIFWGNCKEIFGRGFRGRIIWDGGRSLNAFTSLY